ncbi:DUF4902 domain-containing protein [Methylocaldum gracile]|jgi:hypothetical protein
MIINYQADAEIRDAVRTAMVTLCKDGYVRLTFETFRNLPLFHLLSCLDEDNPVLSSEGAILTMISGYTEWISTTTPAITLGWDWQLTASRGQALCVRIGEPRSNVMLVDAQQDDLGTVKTASLLKTAIDQLSWQDAVVRSFSNPGP